MTVKSEILQNHLKTIAPRAGDFVSTFYNRLYTHYPEIRPLFKDTNRASLFKTLDYIVNRLSTGKTLERDLSEFVNLNPHSDVSPDDYPKVGEALLETLSEFSGDRWNTELESAWTDTVDSVYSLFAWNSGRTRAATQV